MAKAVSQRLCQVKSSQYIAGALGHLESGQFLDQSRQAAAAGRPQHEVACYKSGTNSRPFSTSAQVNVGQSVSTTTSDPVRVTG